MRSLNATSVLYRPQPIFFLLSFRTRWARSSSPGACASPSAAITPSASAPCSATPSLTSATTTTTTTSMTTPTTRPATCACCGWTHTPTWTHPRLRRQVIFGPALLRVLQQFNFWLSTSSLIDVLLAPMEQLGAAYESGGQQQSPESLVQARSWIWCNGKNGCSCTSTSRVQLHLLPFSQRGPTNLKIVSSVKLLK